MCYPSFQAYTAQAGHRQGTINVHNQLFSYVLAQFPGIHSTAGHRQGTINVHTPASQLWGIQVKFVKSVQQYVLSGVYPTEQKVWYHNHAWKSQTPTVNLPVRGSTKCCWWFTTRCRYPCCAKPRYACPPSVTTTLPAGIWCSIIPCRVSCRLSGT